MTTLEPGARLVFTHGFDDSPSATAFLASSPAASITLGLDVLVQLVIAAMTTEPCRIENFSPFISTGTLEFCPTCSSGSVATTDGESCGDAATLIACFAAATAATVPVRSRSAASASLNIFFASFSGTLSCGRFGPARLGSTVCRSSSSVSLNSGSGVSSVRKSPCVLQ